VVDPPGGVRTPTRLRVGSGGECAAEVRHLHNRSAARVGETGGGVFSDVPDNTPESICDEFARGLGRFGWAYKLEGLKLTLFDFADDPIVSIRVRVVGQDADRNPVFVPGLVCRWVPRVPPKITRTHLTPVAAGGKPFARAAGGAFTAAIATVAAPEFDFATLPDDQKRPRIYYMRFHAQIASNRTIAGYSGLCFCIDGHNGPREHIRGQCLIHLDNFYHYRTDALDLRVALFSYPVKDVDGTVKHDPVVGLVVESNGPPPALRWTFRPAVRELLKQK
jgi:hypothetical protein